LEIPDHNLSVEARVTWSRAERHGVTFIWPKGRRGREQQSHSCLLMADDDFENEDWSATEGAFLKSNMSEHWFRGLGLLGAIGLFGTAILIPTE
jgi:hypothetical protein